MMTPCFPVRPLDLQASKKNFDFLVDHADGLDLPFLVDRPGYGDALADGDIGQAGKNGVQLG